MSEAELLRPGRLLRGVGLLSGLSGLALGLAGLQLLVLGGSPYYLAAGLTLLGLAVLLWRGRRASGAWLFLAICFATTVWAVWEAGFDHWTLLPRLDLFAGLGLALLLALVLERRRVGASLNPALLAVEIALGVLAAPMVVSALSPDPPAVPFATPPAPGATARPQSDWPTAGGDLGWTRYSAVDQITPQNVGRLEVAWTTHLGHAVSQGMRVLEASPLMVGGRVFVCNTKSEVIALDPDTGRQLWRFDPKVDLDSAPLQVCRGVAHYRQPGATGPCAERILSFGLDARLFALDAASGRRCPGFGINGEVDLSEGMGVREPGYYYLTAAPAVVGGKVIVGGSVTDNQHVGEPSGAIRAFDAVSGKFLWAWDMERPHDHGPPPPGGHFALGTPNAWGAITGDTALGLVFVPLGNGTPDYVAGHRTPAMNKYTDAVVALDLATGALRWSYQTIHRDVWDYDLASPPTLVDFPTPQGLTPAIIQPTKRGELFVLDRRTGVPLVETVERPVPQGPAPGETVSPTQPFPKNWPSFAGPPLREADMWGLTPFDQLWCRLRFKAARYDGVFTPIGLKPTIQWPGYMGGFEWAGVSVDPERRVLAFNVSRFAMYNQMIPRAEAEQRNIRPFKVGRPIDKLVNAQAGTPYATRITGFVTPLDTPCTEPPFTELVVLDLAARKVSWRRPLGTARDSGPGVLKSHLPIRMGVPAVGGPLVTRSGLIFIAATQERTFRAVDLRTGKQLWSARLPAGGHAAPSTYVSPKTGRQYVLIPASGHFWMKSGSSDALMAYALPTGAKRP